MCVSLGVLMRNRSRAACLAAVLVGALSLQARAQEPVGDAGTASSPPEVTVRHDMFVSLKTVRDFFPTITRTNAEEGSTGPGKPEATRTVAYTTADRGQRVALTVAEYDTAGDALSGYQEALSKSQSSELNPIAISNVGQQVFANTITQGGATSVVMTSLDGSLIVGATMAGYEASTDNISKLAGLVRAEVTQAHKHIGTRRRRG